MKNYVGATIEVIHLSKEDVVKTSNGLSGNGPSGNDNFQDDCFD